MTYPPNYHAFHVTWHGWTKTKPSRIKIESLRFDQYIWISPNGNHMENVAMRHLVDMGFNMVGQSEYSGHGFILFSDTFKPLKDEKI